MTQGPILIDLGGRDEQPPQDVATAPPVPEVGVPQGQAMQGVAQVIMRRPSRLTRWFWGLLATSAGLLVSAAV